MVVDEHSPQSSSVPSLLQKIAPKFNSNYYLANLVKSYWLTFLPYPKDIVLPLNSKLQGLHEGVYKITIVKGFVLFTNRLCRYSMRYGVLIPKPNIITTIEH